jgi:hypothetical protein
MLLLYLSISSLDDKYLKKYWHNWANETTAELRDAAPPLVSPLIGRKVPEHIYPNPLKG